MIRTLTLSVLTTLALAATAHADSITIQVAGRAPAAIHSDIIQAAEKLCAKAVRTDHFEDQYGSQEECVSNTVGDMTNKLAHPTVDMLQVASR